MGQMMPWDEVVKAFPDEWVAFIDYHDNGRSELDGVVVTHHKDRKQFYKTVGELFPQYRHMAIRYTGSIDIDETTPLLWQIFHTV